MKYLIDTNILLKASMEELSEATSHLLINPAHTIFVSYASLWEIIIKKSLGKLTLPDNYITTLEDYGYTLLPLSLKHLGQYEGLPMHHKDPFDRMIIAQSLQEAMPCITSDQQFQSYLPHDLLILEK